MVSACVPRYPFVTLNLLLRNASVSAEEAKYALTTHKDELVRATRFYKHSSPPQHEVIEVRYRTNTVSTQQYPKPTAGEMAYLPTIRSTLGLSQQEAAVLLRDYLYKTRKEAILEDLMQCSNFSELAPIEAVEDFWAMERRNAYSCLVVICAGASQRSTHPFYDCFKLFLDENHDGIQECVLGVVVDLLAARGDRAKGKSVTGFSEVEDLWIMEVFFAYCLFNPLRPHQKEKILRAFVSSAANTITANNRSSLSPRFSESVLDGIEATSLFTAALNLSNGLGALVHPDNDSMDSESNEKETPDIAVVFAQDVEGLKRIDEDLRTCMENWTDETRLLSFSWASYLHLRLNLDPGDVSSTAKSLDSSWHMSHAVSADVFGILRRIGSERMQVDDIISGALYQCFWTDVVGFLLAFPPQRFNPSQVEMIVNLAASLLGRTELHFQVETAENLWEHEDTEEDMVGANSLLRLASAVFPQTFRPLVLLLRTLTVSQNSSQRALHYIADCLRTVTEQSESYQNSLLVLDQDGDSPVLESLIASSADYRQWFQSLSVVCPYENDIVYVQAGEDLLPGSYRPEIRRGSLGVSNRLLTVVTWLSQWDGLGAVDHILQTLLMLLREHKATPTYDDVIVSELILSSLESFWFFDRVCRVGSKSLRESLICDERRIATVSSIVRELCDPGDWVKGSWLTKKRREMLLTASASCIASLTLDSTLCARRALERINSSSSNLPLHSALTSLGALAFPAVAAISRIANSSSYGEDISESLLKTLPTLPETQQTRLASEAFDGDRAGAARVHKFLRAVALPLWLTTSSMQGVDPETQSLHWLLPACCLHLFSRRPNDVLQDPAISSVLVEVLMTAAGPPESSGANKSNVGKDVFLFPALQGALVTCFEALRERNSSLQEIERNGGTRTMRVGGDEKHTEAKLSALERLLLKPDTIHALAAMSSGGAERLKQDKFYDMWNRSEFRNSLPEWSPDSFLYLNFTKKDVLAETVCSWRAWIEDMCAKCLSLQFCCLSQLAQEGDVIQVPWPNMARVAFNFWRGGGEFIRKGYAQRIRYEKSVAAIELAATIIACGQRAAARSLMGPRADTSSKPKVRFDIKVVDSSDRVANKNNTDSATRPTIKQGEQISAYDDNEILSSIVSCLRDSRDSWSLKAKALDSTTSTKKLSLMRELGHTVLIMAACVKFLRVAWESHNSKWFQTFWNSLNIWEVLGSLLRCEGGPTKTSEKLDLAIALNKRFDPLASNMSEKLVSLLNTISIENVVLKQSLSIDVVTAWKSIVVDCLHVFSFEIMFRASEAVVLIQATKEEDEQSRNRISSSMFSSECFVQFSSVFTERWMQVLIPVDRGTIPDSADHVVSSRDEIDQTDPSSIAEEILQPISVEHRTRDLSILLGKVIGFDEHEAAQYQILHTFRRSGDALFRFGTDYAFDVRAILRFLKTMRVGQTCCNNLIVQILTLNAEIHRGELQVEVVAAFSHMASSTLFADSIAPSQPVALTYSSPQFGGKVCRYFCEVLVSIMRSIPESAHSTAIAAETAQVMASLSAQLSNDELEQAALTTMRFPKSPSHFEKECAYTPLGQICAFVNHMLSSLTGGKKTMSDGADVADSIQWLLLTASKLVRGTSFASSTDIPTLIDVSIKTLRIGHVKPSLLAAASVAIAAVLENRKGYKLQTLFDDAAIQAIFTAMANLANEYVAGVNRDSTCLTASSLLLDVARILVVREQGDSRQASFILQQLSGGCVLSFMASSRESIASYEPRLDSRNPSHVLWCAALHLASVAIPSSPTEWRSAKDREQGLKDVLEFGATNLLRIARDSLDMSGDWPPLSDHGREEDGMSSDLHQPTRHVTVGRAAEAEVACKTLQKLAAYSLQIQEKLPDLFHATITELTRFTYQVYRLIRAEPVERWVRPVSQREKDRSHILRFGKEGTVSSPPFSSNSSPWNASPSNSLPVANTPQQRSPSQALRAAIGGLTRGSKFSPGLPPSPGMPPTPQQQAPSPGTSGRVSYYSSPGSPWGPYGSGLITGEGLYFDEEATRCLLRGLSSALAALRRFSDVLDTLLFEPSMALAEDNLGLGVLVAIQYHACNEVYRGAEGERRELLQSVIDNALHLTITHVLAYMEQGTLTQTVKDEVRKRVETVRMRMLKVVPPAPSYSILHSHEFETFLRHLKHPH